jgi:hypothetical protein
VRSFENTRAMYKPNGTLIAATIKKKTMTWITELNSM